MHQKINKCLCQTFWLPILYVLRLSNAIIVFHLHMWTQVGVAAWKQSEVSSQLANGLTNYRHCHSSIRIPEPEERFVTSGRGDVIWEIRMQFSL